MPRPKKKTEKRTRVPFGAHRYKLQLDEIPGYVIRWFNDTPGRIQRAVEGGWEFIDPEEVNLDKLGQSELHEGNSDLNGRVSKIVSKDMKNPVRAFAMKIQKKLYNEDQETKEGKLREIDEALLQGQPGGNKVENQYVPKGHKQRILG